MKTIRSVFLIIIALLLAFPAVAQLTPDITGFARSYKGVLVDNGDFSILQNTLDLRYEKRSSKGSFRADPLIYTYETDSMVFKMRELFVDLYFDKFDLRIGKQQVVWGKADGVFITDVVSPLDLTEFLLPDFNEIRQGVLATKFNYYLGSDMFELIWISVFTPTKRPAQGSIWRVAPDFPAPVSYDWSRSDVTPSLGNSEVFAKYSMLSSKIDFEVMGGYTWDDEPSMHVNRNFSMNNGEPQLESLDITPQYHRLWLTGGSFSTEIEGFVVRGEGAWYNGKKFQTSDPMKEGGLVEKNYLHYVLGVDYNIEGVNMSGQFIQQNIMDYEAEIGEDEQQNTMTFLARYDMFRETLNLELFSYVGLDKGDALIRPKVMYDFGDGISLLLGANIFTGDTEGQFGQFSDNSMVYAKIKYSF
jgi:hypothetical protein